MIRPDTLLAAAGFVPDRMLFPNSWCGHIPFASWLIETERPRLFVELGTHTGNSYLAFCQSVRQSGAGTRCYAVDTWQGDEHSGFYGEEVYAELTAHHEPRYASFSTLKRMTFDQAVSDFEDASISLLHIDGLHTYEAVRHDFENWLPKLAPGALVMFHDTQVRVSDFGVYRLWDELCQRYPLHLEFQHSNGLGVLQVGDRPDSKPLEWLMPGTEQQQQVLQYFTALGEGMLARFVASDAEPRRVAYDRLVKTLVERDASIKGLKTTIETYQVQAKAMLAERDDLIKEAIQEAIAPYQAQAREFADQLSKTQHQAERVLEERDSRITELRLTLKDYESQAEAMLAERDDLIKEAIAPYRTQAEEFAGQLSNVQHQAELVLAERDGQITELRTTLKDYESQAEAMLAERDDLIKQAIEPYRTQADEFVKQLGNVQAQAELTIADLKATISAYQIQAEEFVRQLDQARSHAEQAQEQVSSKSTLLRQSLHTGNQKET